MAAEEPESSAQAAMRDGHVVSRIVSRLLSAHDRLSAALVCRLWNDAVVFESRRLALRSRSLLPLLAKRFSHIRFLDLSPCAHPLHDTDLATISSSLPLLHSVSLGHHDLPHENISLGLQFFALHCPLLHHLLLSSLPNLSSHAFFLFPSHCPELRSVSLENCPSLAFDALHSLSKCSYLEELTLKGKFMFTPLDLAIIGQHCRRLLKLGLDFRSLEVDFVLKSLPAGCPNIQELSLKVRHVDLWDIVKCTTLICLRIETDQWLRLDEAVLQVSAANKNLKELVFITRYSPLSDAAIAGVLQNCRYLEKLHVDASRMSETALICLMQCKTLKSLTLDRFRSSGQGLAEVGLCGLDLNEFALKSGRGIRDVELQTLVQGNQRLEHLDLQCCRGLSPIGFSDIGHCSNLESLNLSFTEVDTLSLMNIADGVKCLKRLSLVKCETISDVCVISRFTALESLNLDQCPSVNDQGLAHIAAGCRQLAHLSLAFTQATDKGLNYLATCSQLRSLRIPYCRNVEGQGLTAIAKACTWFQYAVISHRFKGSKMLEELGKQCCMVRLEIDDMALVPFGFNVLM